MIDGMTIRQATARDSASLSVLGIRTFVEKFGHLYSQENLDAFLAESHDPAVYDALAADKRCMVLVVEADDGKLVAYGVAGPCGLPVDGPGDADGEIKRLYVDRPHQGKGLGRILFEGLLAWCDEQDYSGLYLSVYAGNEGAHRFYQSFGFDRVQEYEFLVGQHRDPEFIFKRIVQ